MTSLCPWPPPPAASLLLQVRTVCGLTNGEPFTGLVSVGRASGPTSYKLGCHLDASLSLHSCGWCQKTTLMLKTLVETGALFQVQRSSSESHGTWASAACAPLCGEHPGAWCYFRR